MAGRVKKPKMPKIEESYFAVCKRDEGGQCLPEGAQVGAIPKKGDTVLFNGEEWKYNGEFGGSHYLSRGNTGKMVTPEELASGESKKKPLPKFPKGGSVEVEEFDGVKEYEMSDQAVALINSGEWKYPMDLLTAADGHRPGAFTSVQDFSLSKAGDAKRMNELFSRYGLKAIAYQGKHGVVIVRQKDDGSSDAKEFVRTARKYLAGATALGDLTEQEHRLLGKWLGYSKKSTARYLKPFKSSGRGEVRSKPR